MNVFYSSNKASAYISTSLLHYSITNWNLLVAKFASKLSPQGLYLELSMFRDILADLSDCGHTSFLSHSVAFVVKCALQAAS